MIYMTRNKPRTLIASFAFLALFPAFARATPLSSCASNGSTCSIYENQLVALPFEAFAGDLIVQNSKGATVDVFRIPNDVVDTGGGTGLGDQAFLYGLDVYNLPDPSTYSVNAVTVALGPAVAGGYYETDYAASFGTVYKLFTPVPEASSVWLAGFGFLLTFAVLCRKRRAGVLR